MGSFSKWHFRKYRKYRWFGNYRNNYDFIISVSVSEALGSADFQRMNYITFYVFSQRKKNAFGVEYDR